MGIEPTQPAWKAGILTIELHPQFQRHLYYQKSGRMSRGNQFFEFPHFLFQTGNAKETNKKTEKGNKKANSPKKCYKKCYN